MAYFFVVYRSNGPDGSQVAANINASLEQHTQGKSKVLVGTTWLIDTPGTAGEVFQALMALIAPADGLLVAPTQQPWQANVDPLSQAGVESAHWANP